MSECARDSLFIVISFKKKPLCCYMSSHWQVSPPEGYLRPHLREGTGGAIRSRHPECSGNKWEERCLSVRAECWRASKIPLCHLKGGSHSLICKLQISHATMRGWDADESSSYSWSPLYMHVYMSSAGCCMPRWFVQLDVHWRVAYGRQQLWFHSMHPYIHQIKHAHMYISVDGD